jgi:hypothetical protein
MHHVTVFPRTPPGEVAPNLRLVEVHRSKPLVAFRTLNQALEKSMMAGNPCFAVDHGRQRSNNHGGLLSIEMGIPLNLRSLDTEPVGLVFSPSSSTP